MDLLRLLPRELACENYGLAKLYRAFETNNFNDLPTVSQLTDDLGNICAIDAMPDKAFVADNLGTLISGFLEPARLTIETGGNVPQQQLRQLVNLSTVLLKALGRLSENTVTTIGSLETAQLEQLVAACNLALQTEQPDEERSSIEETRNLLERKRNAIEQVRAFPLELENMDEATRNDRDVVIRAVQIMGWSLLFASPPLKNDREIVLAAVRQNGWALGFAGETVRNDKLVVMSAIQNNGMAFQFASQELKKNREVAIAAVRQNPTALVQMSTEFQRDPEIRAIAFPRPAHD